MSIRTERVARLIQREVADLLNTEFYEESHTMLTVTGARVTRDLSIAYIYVSVMGDGRQQQQIAFRRLQELTPRIRSALATRIRHQLRSVPELRFFLDESLQQAESIERLLDRARLERERREGSAGDEADDNSEENHS